MQQEKKTISYSQLKLWKTCPYHHKLLKIDEVIDESPPSIYTIFGNALHEALEIFYGVKNWHKEDELEEIYSELEEHFEKQFRKSMAEYCDNYKVLLLEATNTKTDKAANEVLESFTTQGKNLFRNTLSQLKETFGNFTIVTTEENLLEPIEGFDYHFNGYIDLVLQTSDGKYHIIDWKTCSWGWDARKKSDTMTTYQLTLYKHFWCQKHEIELEQVETHFALLKRTAKKDIVEIFRVTSGKKKMKNAIDLMNRALYNISKSNFIKDKRSCEKFMGYSKPCIFKGTEYCR